MALRLRRGTDAERQLITPLEGELIYVTDTKSLYVGDGATIGGVLIASSGDVSNTLFGLLDTDLQNLENGDILVYNSATGEFVNSQSALNLEDVIDVIFTGEANGDLLTYDGVSWTNTPALNVINNTIGSIEVDDLGGVIYNGTPKNGDALIHDGGVWSNRPLSSFADQILSSRGSYELTIIGADSSILVDPVNNILRGNLQGDLYDILGNLIIDEFSKTALVDIKDPTNTYTVLDNFTGDLRHGETGTLMIQGGSTPTFIGSHDGPVRGTIVGPDLQIILNHDTATLFGDVVGSVYGDDSTIVFDGDTGKFNLNDTVQGNIQTRSTDDFPRIIMTRESAADISASDLSYGSIQWRRDDTGGEVTTALITGGNEAIIFGQANDANITADKFMVLDEGSLSIGGFVPTAKLDVRGDIKAQKSITPGVYADAAARDADIASPAEGMLVFLQDTQKFVGYVNDTGLAGGGLSNATPGWVDLY